jgi:hypothetical protein
MFKLSDLFHNSFQALLHIGEELKMRCKKANYERGLL